MTARTMLAIFAHPDDESLVAGGTLAAWAAAGAEVVILSLTRGERGTSAVPVEAGETLGSVREAELRAAAAELGATAECLGYPDGELRWQDEAEVLGVLAAHMHSLRPEVVITFGPEGLYWHKDHIAVHRCTLAALDRVALDGIAPAVWLATWPEGRMAALVDAMTARGLPAGLWGLPPSAFGAPPSAITATVDVRSLLAAKLRALRCHRSQLGTDHLFQAIPDDLAVEFLGTECFVRAALTPACSTRHPSPDVGRGEDGGSPPLPTSRPCRDRPGEEALRGGEGAGFPNESESDASAFAG